MTDKNYGYSIEVNELLWEKDKEIENLKRSETCKSWDSCMETCMRYDEQGNDREIERLKSESIKGNKKVTVKNHDKS